MIIKTFFINLEKDYDRLKSSLQTIELEEEDPIVVAEQCLMLIDVAIRRLKSTIVKTDFESIAEEINFFKHYKPKFIALFIFYSKILEEESSNPNRGQKQIRKHYELAINRINNYYKSIPDFYNYFRRNATYLDYKYFVRYSYDLKMKLSYHLYNFDDGFTTSHDPYIANILANDMLHDFYTKKLIKLNASDSLTEGTQSVVWTGPKVALIELLYALYHSGCFNKGNLDFSHLVRSTENNLNIDLGNYYKVIGEIKNRKHVRLKFLQSLNDQMNQLLLNGDQ